MENPYDGSTSVKFDSLLKKLGGKIGEDTLINLEPGIFRTKGWNYRDNRGWHVKSGQRFRGAGIRQTVLCLQLDASDYGNNLQYRSFAVLSGVFNTNLEGIEVADLTIDCNLQNQPLTSDGKFPFIMVFGAEIIASNSRLKRTRIINFGTRTPPFIDGVQQDSAECFPLVVGGIMTQAPATTFNVQLEDSHIEQPYHSNARETTCASLGTATTRLNNVPTRCGAIRGCYFDLDYVNPSPAPPVQVASVDYTVGVYQTITTRLPHNVSGGYVEIWGATLGAYNGRFPVLATTPSPNDGT
jgi:hypothetical protein